MVLDLGPLGALGCEEIVATLTLVDGTNSLAPVLAEEAMHDAVFVHAGDDKAADVGNERNPRWHWLGPGVAHGTRPGPGVAVSARTRCVRHGTGRVDDGGRGPLEGQADVDEGCDGLDAIVVLGVVEEEALAALVRGMPLEDVKLGLPRIGGP